jgi:hypothetical protein
MSTGELIPIHPLPIDYGHGNARFMAENAEPLPVAIKLYDRDDPVFEAAIGGADATAPHRLEARAGGDVVLTGEFAPLDGGGAWRSRLALTGDRPGEVVHLPRGALAWHLLDDADERQIDLPSPELLIFPPEGDLSFAPRGLPPALLRALATVHARPGPAIVAAAVPPWKAQVDKVFANNPPRYDVFQGAPHYTDIPDWDNLVFHLGRYEAARADPSSLLNCYDAAAYLQILLRPAFPTRYCFMRPFGYLMQTDLIGRGQCNNPFYRLAAPPVVSRTAASRTSFANHAFCAPSQSGGEVIADACAGPHYADTPAAYVAAAVDTVTPVPPRIRAGTVADIGYHRGVVNVQNLVRPGAEMAAAVTRAMDSGFAANRAAFIQAIGAPAVPSAREATAVPDPRTATRLDGWDLVHEDFIVGYPESSRQWRFVQDGSSLVFTCWMANDAETARDHFVQLGSVHQSGEPVFGPGPPGLGDVSAQSIGPERQVLIWNRATLTARLDANDARLDLAMLAAEMASGGEEKIARSGPPAIHDLVLTPSPVVVGDIFTIRVVAGAEALVDFALSEDLATFEGQDGTDLTFRARARGVLQVAVAIVDPGTMLSDQRTATVTIVAATTADGAGEAGSPG